jgi:hypothetical protein
MKKLHNTRRRIDTLTSPERIKEAFNYNPKTGKLTWAIDRRCVHPGDSAGTRVKSPKGVFLTVRLDGRLYCVNQVVWCWVTGEWPAEQVDHQNLDSSDNRWDNLREATNQQNCANRGLNTNNKTGYRGVYWYASRQKWVAYLRKNGKHVFFKYFKIKSDAVAAVREARKVHFGEWSST